MRTVRAKQEGPVCLVCPTAFGEDGLMGGGERFVEELARALARRSPTKLIAFARRPPTGPGTRRTRPAPGLERVILPNRLRAAHNPFSFGLFRELSGARVIHACQYYTLPTFFAALYGNWKGVPVFVTDLGGGGWTPGYHLDQSRWVVEHLPLSDYASLGLPGANRRFQVIYGGVDPERYPPRETAGHDGSVAFLGRILPHKGIHFLIDGLPPGTTLHVLGTVADSGYHQDLVRRAQGKDVRFHLGLGDDAVLDRLRRSMALVHPTPVDENGNAGANELFGLALVEAMACGCPVIATSVASLPEIVTDGENGLLVPPNEPRAIAAAIERLKSEPSFWARLSANARERVVERFTWDAVADRCMAAYASSSAAVGPRA